MPCWQVASGFTGVLDGAAPGGVGVREVGGAGVRAITQGHYGFGCLDGLVVGIQNGIDGGLLCGDRVVRHGCALPGATIDAEKAKQLGFAGVIGLAP